ncbi:MAG: hypothetical protein GAK31_03650 [Stenotrophomonas maltophilia]|uniref:Uncharacterized protein n=1 Tax=Stenotrophomonas maltophilia TaxID=40324 RepID=A0A7V8FE77_STEMA|nr:MAG: hypothetical protein GAK31_03650 [Stenotrophomonas maltophilia]
MNNRMLTGAALLAAAAVAIVAVWPRPAPPAAVSAVAPAVHAIGTATAAPPSPPRAAALEAAGKIAPGSYQSLGGKAYQVFRGHEVRPPGNALAYVQQLATRSARGDATATYEIYLTVNECRTFASDRGDQLADSAQALGAGGPFLQKSERLLQECESLLLDRDVFQDDWLTRAAA